MPLDVTLAEQLFREFHRVLLINPLQADALIHALDGLARLQRDPLIAAWPNRARGTAQHVRGASRPAARLLEQAAVQLRRADRRADAGDVYRVLVDLYTRLGDDRRALRAEREARACYDRHTPERARRLADLEMNLGGLHHFRDRWKEALRCFERAEPAFLEYGEPGRISMCLKNQAVMLSVLDRRDEARSRLLRARTVAESSRLAHLVRRCDYHLAELDMREGNLDQAMALLEQLIGENQDAGSPIDAGFCLLEFAESALQSNLSTRALAAARSAGQIFAWARHASQWWPAAAIEAAALASTGQYATARAKLNQAMAGKRALRNRVGAATHGLQLAALELSASQPTRALALIRRASSVLARSGSDLRLAKALGIRARAELALKQLTAAQRSATQAVRAAERSGSRRARLESQLALALVSEARGERSRAFRQFAQAERLVEQIRVGLSREDSRLAFLVDKIDLYERLIRNRLAVGSPSAVRQALHFAERGKARVLAERLMSGAGRQLGSSASRSALKRRLAALDRDLAAAESRLGEGQQTPGLRRTLAPRVTRLSRERLALLDSIARLAPSEAQLQGLAPRRPLALLERLAPDQVVLEYVATGDALHVFVAQRGSLRVFENQARLSEVSRLVEQLRFHLGKGVLGDAHQERFGTINSRACRHYLTRLEQLLIGPQIRPYLRQSLRVVPHGVLYGVPFHALEHNGTPLIERSEISYVPSLAVAGWLDQRSEQPITGPPLVLGVPDAATPQILEEVQAIRNSLPQAEVLTGRDVTRTALLDRSSGRALTHVACHGFYQDGETAAAGLKLGDAWIGLDDLESAQGSSDLVILSGCETGRGTVLTGDEWLGLATGFLRTGARTVIAALWELHDASAATLMSDFYAAFVSGQTAAAAMAHAQRRARSNDPSPPAMGTLRGDRRSFLHLAPADGRMICGPDIAILRSSREPHMCRLRIVALCLPLLALLVSAIAVASPDDPVSRELVVELQHGEDIQQVAQASGCTIASQCQITASIPFFDAYLLQAATPEQASAFLAALPLDPRVDDAEPHDRLEDPEGIGNTSPILDRSATPSDFRLQPAAQLIRTAATHQRQTARNVVVALLDTGIELGHAELVEHAFDPRGFDFAGGRHWAWPDSDGIDNDLDGSVDEALHHGTVVAGLINLAAPNARILAIRVLDEDGRGTVFGIANGILLALEQGADVINLSFGSPRSSSLIRKAIQEAVRRGVVVVTAAGNRGVNEVDFPCSHSDVICVAAVDDNKQKAVWSNYGSRVDLTAPGNLPLSAFNRSEYAHWVGTSFAAPLVSGAAALMIEKYPGLTPDQIRWSLKSTTQPDNSPEYLDALGTGVLDAAAVSALVTSDRTSLRLRAAGANSEVTFSELQGVTRYDIARGEVGRLRLSWDRVERGSLVCLADNTTTRQALDAAVPIAGAAQFYLFRTSTGSYAFSSNGLRREATGSDCNAAP